MTTSHQNSNPKLNLLKEEVANRITSIDESRVYYRKRSFGFYISITILSAIVTILLGSAFESPDLENWLKRISLALTAMITVLSAYNIFFNHKELWVANNQALNSLKELRFNIDFREADATPVSTAEIDDLKKKYQLILDELNSTWAKSRATK